MTDNPITSAAATPEQAANEPIRHFIRELRTAQFMSQEVLATRAGLGRETLSEYETGKRDPRPGTMRRIAEALNVTPPWRIYDLSEKVAAILMAMPAESVTGDEDQGDDAEPTKPTPKKAAGKRAAVIQEHDDEDADDVDAAGGNLPATTGKADDDLWFLTDGGALIPAFENLPMEVTPTNAASVTERWQHVAMQWHREPNPEHLRIFLEKWAGLVIRTRQVKGKKIDRAAEELELEEYRQKIISPIYEHILKEIRRARGGDAA